MFWQGHWRRTAFPQISPSQNLLLKLSNENILKTCCDLIKPERRICNGATWFSLILQEQQWALVSLVIVHICIVFVCVYICVFVYQRICATVSSGFSCYYSYIHRHPLLIIGHSTSPHNHFVILTLLCICAFVLLAASLGMGWIYIGLHLLQEHCWSGAKRSISFWICGQARMISRGMILMVIYNSELREYLTG